MSDSTATDDFPHVIQSIKGWLSNCDGRHIGTCVRSYSSSSTQHKTSWLIYVKDRCIVQGTNSDEYLALSYTWRNNMGQINEEHELRLLSNNTDSLTSANALDQYKSKIPKVILDAMELTSTLGKRYLWVDRLCIVQDGPKKASEVSSMDQVYSGAYMTIIAAAEHGMFLTPEETIYSPEVESSSLGFFGVPAFDSESMTASERAEAIRASREYRVRCYYTTVSQSQWAKRAWTYQEYLLSKRVVFFLGTRIFWQCECSVWDLQHLRPKEDDEASLDIVSEPAPTKQLFIPTWPDFSIYVDLICPYNGRDLSYQSDGLLACQGILNYLAPAFPTGFLFGLPKLYLDYALLWQPLEGCHGSKSPSNRRPTLPSWSWCGWQCFIDPESFQAGLNINHRGCHKRDTMTSWKLRNTISWECANSTEKSTERPLLSLNHISSWVSHAFFFPAATLKIRFEPFRGQYNCSGFISAFTNPVLTHKPLNHMPKVVVLQDLEGKFSGLLRVTGDSKCKRGEPIELIAISQSSANGKDLQSCFEEKVLRRSRYANSGLFHAIYDLAEHWVDTEDGQSAHDMENYQVITEGEYEKDLKLPYIKDDQDYEFYNVLWVQRGKDNVAYRAGCGRVPVECWKGKGLENIRITLG